jgi:hypothetical protein
MTEPLTAEHFLAHVDKTFSVTGGRHALTLAGVEPGPAVPPETGLRQPFIVIFRGPPGDVLAEGTYTLAVEGGPSFELYVIPIHTPDVTRQDYQAAFN